MPRTAPIAPSATSARTAATACEPSDWKPIWQARPLASTPAISRSYAA